MSMLVRQYCKRLIPRELLIRRLPKKNTNSILLTFDDGPHPEITPRVLQILAEYDAHSIFFIPGSRIERAPGILSDIIKHGHEIGNHTFMHSNGVKQDFFEYRQDIIRCQDSIERYSGVRPRFFRPAYGILSLNTLLAPKLCGLKTLTWTVDAHDIHCKDSKTASEAAGRLIATIVPRDIVLLHDDNPYVIEILETIMPELARRGINFNTTLECID